MPEESLLPFREASSGVGASLGIMAKREPSRSSFLSFLSFGTSFQLLLAERRTSTHGFAGPEGRMAGGAGGSVPGMTCALWPMVVWHKQRLPRGWGMGPDKAPRF